LAVSDVKSLKRGEKLFEENKPVESIKIVTSGRVAYFVTRSNKRLDFGTSHANAVFGDEGLFGAGKSAYGGEAAGAMQYMELPLEPIKAQIERLPQALRLLIRSLAEEVKVLRGLLKSQKLETETLPCPQPSVARIFAAVGIVTKQSGKKRPTGEWEIGWETLKLYATRFFLEKPNRVQSGIEILTKLGLAEMQFQKNEDDVDELRTVVLKDLDFVERFAEFYQFYYYKPGRSEILYFDKMAYQIVVNLLEVSEGQTPDHNGHVRLGYDQMLKDLREKKNFEFKADHVRILERKGFMASRKSTDTSVLFLFDRQEFHSVARFWQVLHEIDKWNEFGKVKMVEEKIAEPAGGGCPECAGLILPEHKFCPHCGFKIAA
jgi:hypothetical protein